MKIWLFLALIIFLFSFNAFAEEVQDLARQYAAYEKNGDIRAHAIKYLAGCGNPECMHALQDALHDSYWLVRYRAIESMKPNSDLIQPFIEALDDLDDMVWLAAINGLIKIGEPGLSGLWAAAKDKRPFVRQGAIIVLSEIGGPIEFEYNESGGCCSKKHFIHEKSFEILKDSLEDTDSNIRRAATEAFRCVYAANAKDILLKNTQDPEPDIRAAAFNALADECDHRSIDLALAALKDSDSNVREAAEDLLRYNFSDSDGDVLDKWLQDKNAGSRCLAIYIITDLINSNSSNKNLLDLFRKYAKDLISCGFEESHVASTVLLDLAEHSNDEAFLENLIYHLGGSTFAFSEKTIYLDALKRSRHAILRRKLAEILAWGFYNYGKDKDRDLMKPFLIDRDPAVRCYAALVRAKNRDVSVIPILKKLGKNSNQSIRSNAFFALGLLMPETADYLSSILIHNSEKLTEKDIEDIFRGIEEWEYRELKHIKDNRQKEKAAEAIANITKSANDSIALKAIKCLFEFDPENAQSQLQKYFSNKDPKIRIKSIKIARFHNQRDKILLEKIADENETEEVREQLLEEFKYDPFTKELIAILQKKIVPDKLRRKILEYAIPSAHFFFSYLNEFMMDPNICVLALDRQTRPISQLLPELENNKTPPICRISIAKNLSASTDPIVIERLLKIAADKDPAIRRAIATALGDISSSMALPGLEQLLQDPDPDVRKKAESAINKINQ